MPESIIKSEAGKFTQENADFILSNIDNWIDALLQIKEASKFPRLEDKEGHKLLGEDVCTKVDMVNEILWELSCGK